MQGLISRFHLACWCFFIFIPWFFLSHHFQKNLTEESVRSQRMAEASLVAEMKNFRQSLLARGCIEHIMRRAEKDLGLVPQVKTLDISAKDDPFIYTAETPKMIADFLQKEFNVRPSYILSFGYNGKHLEQLFLDDFSHRSAEKKQILKKHLAFFLVERLTPPPAGYPEFIEEFYTIECEGKKKPIEPGKNEVNNILRVFFSGLAEFPENLGVCYPFFSSRMGGKNTFIFANGLYNRKTFFGAYFVVFSDALFSAEYLLQMAVKNNENKNFLRSYVPFDQRKIGKFKVSQDRVEYFSALPPDFVNSHHRKMYSNDRQNAKIMLRVSSEKDFSPKNIRQIIRLFSFAQKIFFLILFTAIVFSSLYAKTRIPSLRLRFLGVTSFVVMIPFVYTAYFSILLLDSFAALNHRKIEIEATVKMFEVSRFIEDLRIRRQVLGILTKKRLSDLASKKSFDIHGPNVEKVIPKVFKVGVDYLSINGEGRHINPKTDKEEPRSMNFLLASKYLNNLGVLNSETEKNRKSLKLVSLAGGFLDDLSQGYVEGISLARESQETKDLTELSDMHKMFHFLIPANPQNDEKIAGIAFMHLFGISRFGLVFDRIGLRPELLLHEEKALASHRFAIGRRTFHGLPEKYFPANLKSFDSLKLTLDNSVLAKSSGQLQINDEKGLQVATWRYFPDQEYSIAGITTAKPDLWLTYLASVFPLLVFLFCFLSIIIMTDMLFEFLVKPIYGFIAFIREIGHQNFSARIRVEAGDEYAMLADSFNEMAEGLAQREKLRRFVSDKLFQEVENNSELEKLVSMESEIAVLASDIRQFTSLTEKHQAREVVELLNEYFTLMGKAIADYGGVIERFVGDAIVAAFYPAPNQEHHSVRAVNAAISMRRALKTLNHARRAREFFEIENGIGIVSGRAFSAVIGADSGRKVFTVIGTVVDLAEKLEARTAAIGGSRIVVCSETAQNCRSIIDLTAVSEDSQIFFVKESQIDE